MAIGDHGQEPKTPPGYTAQKSYQSQKGGEGGEKKKGDSNTPQKLTPREAKVSEYTAQYKDPTEGELVRKTIIAAKSKKG